MTKLTKYNKDNILGWTEKDFEDIIYDFVQCNRLSINPCNPCIDKHYISDCDKVRRRRMGLTEDVLLQDEKQRLQQRIQQLDQRIGGINDR